MGMLDDLGVGGTLPKIDLSFLSSSWIYVVIIFMIGLILVIGVALFLFFTTYKKRIVLFENISGQGYQPVLKSRARVIKIGVGGAEVLKTLVGGHFVSAYGRKMGKNIYWYAKGQDGYWYNVVLGDLDAKQGMLDIEPIDRDVRMFHVAIDRLSQATYNKRKWMEKYGVHMMLFLFLIVLVLGMWFIVGKIGDAVAPLGQSSQNALEIQKMNVQITNQLDNIARSLGKEIQITNKTSGIVPAG
ncbi:MAG: hypothetical protein ACW98D_21655 [Promethearchaeota archaeon]|jgi:hypothetical protein